MNCKKCGSVLEEDSLFCANCGTKVGEEVTETDVQKEAEAADSVAANKGRSLGKIIGLIVGTALIVVGIMRIMDSGTSISSTSFGADFYTYTYRGIVAISELLASIQVTLGWVVVAIGAAIDVYVLCDK